MSLKNDKIFFKSKSITFQLTMFYTLATSLLLMFITFSLYLIMKDILYKTEHQFLSDEMVILEHIVHKKQHQLGILKQEVQEIPLMLNSSVYTYYIRILDDHRQPIIETNGMQAILKGNNFFEKKLKDDQKKDHMWWVSKNGKDYLLMQTATQFSQPFMHAWIIQVALDVTYQHKVAKQYHRNLLLALTVGTFAAFIIGYMIARRSMRRLHELTEAAKEITVESLHQRINPLFWPKELRALGEAFNEMLNRIEASFSRLTQFSDDLAHELRTPVNNLIGETELALSRESTLEELKEVLESNLEESQRINHMIENLLFLARTENPKTDIKKVKLQVHHEVALIKDFYQAMADEKQINITIQGEAELTANSVMFRRLLSNLLSNAIKYTSAPGLIQFDIQKIPNDYVQIRVTDTGIGIAAEHLPRIFDRFYRIDSARSQASGGVGLGLAIVKSIVEAHHGVIFMTSELGNGTVITINLPL